MEKKTTAANTTARRGPGNEAFPGGGDGLTAAPAVPHSNLEHTHWLSRDNGAPIGGASTRLGASTATSYCRPLSRRKAIRRSFGSNAKTSKQ